MTIKRETAVGCVDHWLVDERQLSTRVKNVFNSSGVKLMLVLSEPVLADLTSFRLELLGYRVETLGRGIDASAAISKSLPDLLIVDTSLRDGDGLEWVARVRSEHTASELPILVFSLDTSLETVERAHHAGAQDYLISPFDPTVMEEKIVTLVANRATSDRKRIPQLTRSLDQTRNSNSTVAR